MRKGKFFAGIKLHSFNKFIIELTLCFTVACLLINASRRVMRQSFILMARDLGSTYRKILRSHFSISLPEMK